MKYKELSSYIDFETIDEQEEEEGFGISRRAASKISKKIAFVVCPFCGLHRKLSKTGQHYIKQSKRKEKTLKIKSERSEWYNPKKNTAFNLYNLEEPFISIREKAGGRSGGFPEIDSYKLSDIPNLPEQDKKILLTLVNEIRQQCKKFLKYTDEIMEEIK